MRNVWRVWENRVDPSSPRILCFSPAPFNQADFTSSNSPGVSVTTQTLLSVSGVQEVKLVSAVTRQDVEEVVDLVFVQHGHLGGALGAADRVVQLVHLHPCGRGRGRLLRCGLHLPPLPPLLPVRLRLVAKNLVWLHRAVHDEHGSVLSPVLLMSETQRRDGSAH